jgi:hypothetical protein
MTRWLIPRTRGGRVVVQIGLLLMVAGAVYLLVFGLGSNL